jgi:hypothetical protein
MKSVTMGLSPKVPQIAFACNAIRAAASAADATSCPAAVGHGRGPGVSILPSLVVALSRHSGPGRACPAAAAARRHAAAALLAVSHQSAITILVSALVSSAGCAGGQTRFGSSRPLAGGCVAAAASHRARSGCHGAVPPPRLLLRGWAIAVVLK